MDMRYQAVQLLGQGAYGRVWKCLDLQDNSIVAIKEFKGTAKVATLLDLAVKEIKLAEQLTHPHVVQCKQGFRTSRRQFFMVMEYLPSTLGDELQAHPHGLDPAHVKKLMWQMLDAVAHLHAQGVMHRDLKPRNILLTKDGNAKICDFGLACRISKDGLRTPYVTTRWYRAPEVLVGDGYDESVDIWSLGCIFAEMAAGTPLFPGSSTASQIWEIVRVLGGLAKRQVALVKVNRIAVCQPCESDCLDLKDLVPQLNPAMMEVLTACLHPDPTRRHCAADIMKLPYFFNMRPWKEISIKPLALAPPKHCGSAESRYAGVDFAAQSVPIHPISGRSKDKVGLESQFAAESGKPLAVVNPPEVTHEEALCNSILDTIESAVEEWNAYVDDEILNTRDDITTLMSSIKDVRKRYPNQFARDLVASQMLATWEGEVAEVRESKESPSDPLACQADAPLEMDFPLSIGSAEGLADSMRRNALSDCEEATVTDTAKEIPSAPCRRPPTASYSAASLLQKMMRPARKLQAWAKSK